MENASKALVMAGGILIAILVIGALLLMINQIGSYEKAQTSNVKDSQLAQFNYDFERYTDDNGITGVDIVSLINKVNDYNKRALEGGTTNSINYDIKMSIEITGFNEFNKTYAYDKERDTDSLFPKYSYTFDENNVNNELKKLLNDFSVDEGNIGIEQLRKLSSIYDASKSKDKNIESIKEKLVEINSSRYSEWNGTSPTPTLDSIKKYRQYSEFKSATFIISEEPYYNNGQIQKLYFKFDK